MNSRNKHIVTKQTKNEENHIREPIQKNDHTNATRAKRVYIENLLGTPPIIRNMVAAIQRDGLTFLHTPHKKRPQ